MHWGSASHGDKGSEHFINNEQSTMELHLVHFNGKFADGSAALASNERDALAGVCASEGAREGAMYSTGSMEATPGLSRTYLGLVVI